MSQEVRVATLQEYVSAVILRDIIERHGVGNIVALRALTRHIIGNNPSTLFSINKFWGSLKSVGIAITKTTLMDYISGLKVIKNCGVMSMYAPQNNILLSFAVDFIY